MTGREKMTRMLEGGARGEIPVLLPYLGIFMRDHWKQVTDVPWWAIQDGNLETSLQAERDLHNALDIDWVMVGPGRGRAWRENHRVSEEGDGIFLINESSGEKTELSQPRAGGGKITSLCRVRNREDADRHVPAVNGEELYGDGELDLAEALVNEFGSERYILSSIGAPFWGTFACFGFEQMMTNLVHQPDLVEYVLDRLTSAAEQRLRALARFPIDGIWLEDCYSSRDLISLEHFRRFALPYVRRLIETCREVGLHSVYYFCGDISDRLDDLADLRPDALSFEESKKGFVIEIDEVADTVGGRSALLGNVDAIGIVQNGTREEMARELERQVCVGRKHGRFAVSLGSPVTPATSLEKLQGFLALARERADTVA